MSQSPETPASDAHRADIGMLLTQHLDAMRSYVQVRLGKELRTHESVSDIVQSAAREILDDPGRFHYQGEDAFRAFLARVIDNKILNRLRKQRTLRRSGEKLVSSFEHLALAKESAPTPSEEAMSREEIEQLRATIDELDEEDRRLLSMHKILGISMADIARELELPETTVRSRMARILAHLAVRMGGSSSV